MKQPAQFLERPSLFLLLLFFLAVQSYAAEKTKITLAYSTTGPTAVGLWMAKEIGAFDKYGADPNLIFISSSPVMVPALISGDVQGGIAGANAVISAVLGRRFDRGSGEPRQSSLPSPMGPARDQPP